MAQEKSLQELEALQHRLQSDVSRSRMQDMFGLDNRSPLVQNLNRVNEQIKQAKQSK